MSRQEVRVIVSTSVPPEVAEQFENDARRQNLTLAGYTRQALLDRLEKSTARQAEVKQLQPSES